MPVRTVVLAMASLSERGDTDTGHALLINNYTLQMAGRVGRRG